MVERFVSRVVDHFVKKKLIRSEYAEQYKCELHALMGRIVKVFSLVLIGLWLSDIWSTICYLITFFVLHKRTGGFHIKSFKKCYVHSIFSFILIIQLAELLDDQRVVCYILLAISTFVICMIGTVKYPDMEQSSDELRDAKISSRMIVLLFATLAMWAEFIESCHFIMVYMMLAIVLCAVLLVMAKIVVRKVNKNKLGEKHKKGHEGGSPYDEDCHM